MEEIMAYIEGFAEFIKKVIEVMKDLLASLGINFDETTTNADSDNGTTAANT